jgi:ADP-ribose pyrophosphatase
MAKSAELSLPKIELELLEDLSPAEQKGFLRLVRQRYRAKYPDGTLSTPFLYDSVERDSIDAVVIAAHFIGPAGERRVYLRSAVRPPLMMRQRWPSAVPNESYDGLMWELPAGLIDIAEQSPAGVPRAAQRELLEELGFDIAVAALRPLGPSMFPVPGFCAERQFYFEVTVNPSQRREPELDGSALEHFGVVLDVALKEALEMCSSGATADAKSELALRRLAERFA